jgi:kynureninase
VVAPAALFGSPNALAPHYRRFGVDRRLLLTGHSHQAWPDVAFEGQAQAWLDAAELVDDKWERAFAKADRVRAGFAALLEDRSGAIALGPSVHDLLVRFLSALPLRGRPKLVTTDGEFHSVRRQLDRLAEEAVEVARVGHLPTHSLAERLIGLIDTRTAAVVVSAVFYEDGHRAHGLGELAAACARQGTALLVDAYHALDAIPFALQTHGLEQAFVTGGGYKYCQLGEGNCFLRIPPGIQLRPLVTGWFSEFGSLAGSTPDGRVGYGQGASSFAGATYDPASHYRAASVFDFFETHDLTPAFLRTVSQHQVEILATRFDAMNAAPTLIDRDRSVPLSELGGFLSLRSPKAAQLGSALHDAGVLVDFRGSFLRLGPAPYLSDAQLEQAMDTLAEVLRRFRA